GLRATRDALVKRNEEILQKSMDEDRSRNTAEVSETEDNDAKIESLDADIAFATKQLARAAVQASPVIEQAKAHEDLPAGIASASGMKEKAKAPKKEPGLAFAQYTKCFLLGKTLG